MGNKIKPICGICGATDVRIYRDYGMFRRSEEDRCNECIDEERDGSRGWYVPCILDENGYAWGYTSVPEEDCEKFYALPEKSTKHPFWVINPSGWSDGTLRCVI